ncbi:hypothetical protein BpHYR1_038585, partial [Brachionus plicatilis]
MKCLNCIFLQNFFIISPFLKSISSKNKNIGKVYPKTFKYKKGFNIQNEISDLLIIEYDRLKIFYRTPGYK